MSRQKAAIWRLLRTVVAAAALVGPPAWAEQVALYQAGGGSTAISPELYGWNPYGVLSPADAHGVVDTVGGPAAAWQIADVAVGGAAPQYYQPLDGFALPEARSQGWRMTANARLVGPSLAAPSMGLGVYFDSAAYLLQLDLDRGDLYAYLWDNNNPASLLTQRLTGAADATAYHDYELRWSPASGLASLYFDGRHVVDWDGVPTLHGPNDNLYQFGASATGGSGVMNFRRVEFATISSTASTGDYNGDGAVDAADYSVWRDNLGGRLPAADGNGDGLINQADYAVWRSNFGDTTAGGPGGVVPAPSSLVTLGMLVVVWSGRHRAATL